MRVPNLRCLSLLCAVALLAACSRPEPAPEPVRAVRSVLIENGSAGSTHEYAAEVRARVESRLSFRVGGKLVRRHVDLGDTVRAGQVLAQLDPQDLRLGQDSARAALSSAQASFDLAAADHKRYQELLSQGFISAAELERRDATLKAARASLEQARAQSAVQGNQAGYATLVADVSGVVTAVEAEPGQVVAAGSPVLRVAQDGPRDLAFSVAEDRAASIKALLDQPGRARVRLWNEGAEPLPAVLREIAAAADPVTRTFLVKADIGGAASKTVRLGQTATVLVDTPRRDGVVKLPLSALREEQGRTTVWVVDPASMKVQVQPVQVGGADGNEAVVTGGLQAGQRVVTAGVHVLTPGQTVRLYVDPRVPKVAAAPSALPSAAPASAVQPVAAK